ncbi:inositol-3-phosphate synthase [Haladaptatus salinisoli]|uniref:inositol-3-phosphate synthase n=1 Tax=Haladaptatus salinisoli TaxID=2884876 RepID=UPI001D0B66F5|nr:inositol-3-phosphate synthase [Haladaptatus salinisoli]
MSDISVAVAGVGNCASALVQGVEYYRENDTRSGLAHPELGGYRPSDVEFVAAFDIDRRKVGRDLSEAIYAGPNCTGVISESVPEQGVDVRMGPPLDGVASHMNEAPAEESFRVADRDPVDVAEVLRETDADVLVNYMPVGSQEAVEYYATSCLDAGVAMVNCMPVFVASDSEWGNEFEDAGLPIVGDDIKSQLGATVLHRTLARLFDQRGVDLDATYQLNVGGNTDFLNMLERERLETKKISKTEAVQSQLTEKLDDRAIHISPSDHVSWLGDNKVAFVRMKGDGFGGAELTLEARLSVEDSPNSGGMAIDAIRACKLALERDVGGPLSAASAVTMKHPPVQYTDEEAERRFTRFAEEKSP